MIVEYVSVLWFVFLVLLSVFLGVRVCCVMLVLILRLVSLFFLWGLVVLVRLCCCVWFIERMFFWRGRFLWMVVMLLGFLWWKFCIWGVWLVLFFRIFDLFFVKLFLRMFVICWWFLERVWSDRRRLCWMFCSLWGWGIVWMFFCESCWVGSSREFLWFVCWLIVWIFFWLMSWWVILILSCFLRLCVFLLRWIVGVLLCCLCYMILVWLCVWVVEFWFLIMESWLMMRLKSWFLVWSFFFEFFLSVCLFFLRGF